MKLFVPPTLWYEDEADNYLGAPGYDMEPGAMPEGAHYQVAQFPTMLRTSYVGPEGEVAAAERSWWEGLVLAMATWGGNGASSKTVQGHGRYRLSEAILIAATACERCMNALAWDYEVRNAAGAREGYPVYGRAYERANTRCHFCDPSMRKELKPAAEPEPAPKKPETVYVLLEQSASSVRAIKVFRTEEEADEAWKRTQPASLGHFLFIAVTTID